MGFLIFYYWCMPDNPLLFMGCYSFKMVLDQIYFYFVSTFYQQVGLILRGVWFLDIFIRFHYQSYVILVRINGKMPYMLMLLNWSMGDKTSCVQFHLLLTCPVNSPNSFIFRAIYFESETLMTWRREFLCISSSFFI